MKKEFVRLHQPESVPAKYRAEFNAALRELSPTGIYRLKHIELTDEGVFYYLEGAMSPHSSYLLETVNS